MILPTATLMACALSSLCSGTPQMLYPQTEEPQATVTPPPKLGLEADGGGQLLYQRAIPPPGAALTKPAKSAQTATGILEDPLVKPTSRRAPAATGMPEAEGDALIKPRGAQVKTTVPRVPEETQTLNRTIARMKKLLRPYQPKGPILHKNLTLVLQKSPDAEELPTDDPDDTNGRAKSKRGFFKEGSCEWDPNQAEERAKAKEGGAGLDVDSGS